MDVWCALVPLVPKKLSQLEHHKVKILWTTFNCFKELLGKSANVNIVNVYLGKLCVSISSMMELTLESQDFSGSVKHLETTLLSMLSTDVWINSGLATKWNRDGAGDSPVSFGPLFSKVHGETFHFFNTKIPKGNALRLACKNTQFRINTEPGKRQFPTVSVGWVQAFFPKNFTNVKVQNMPVRQLHQTPCRCNTTQLL